MNADESKACKEKVRAALESKCTCGITDAAEVCLCDAQHRAVLAEEVKRLMPELPKEFFTVKPDGCLVGSTYKYTDWTPGDEEATLDGGFTPRELRAIAAHMEKPR